MTISCVFGVCLPPPPPPLGCLHGRYVAAGEWPSSGDDDAAPAGTTGRVNIPKRFRKSALQRADGSFPRNLGEVAPPAPACCYKAEITGVRGPLGCYSFRRVLSNSPFPSPPLPSPIPCPETTNTILPPCLCPRPAVFHVLTRGHDEANWVLMLHEGTKTKTDIMSLNRSSTAPSSLSSLVAVSR